MQQAIYYPGFTIGGAAEPLAIITLAAWLFVVAAGSNECWLVGLALVAAIGTHVLFWTVVQPVNREWLKFRPLGQAGKRFFGTDASSSETADWTQLRNRWELGHLARTVTATAAFVLTTLALVAA